MSTILNRLGHSENYKTGLLIETAQLEALDMASSLLTPEIERGVTNILFHSVWDNFNEKLNSTRGPSAINITTGMMCQEVANVENAPVQPALPEVER